MGLHGKQVSHVIPTQASESKRVQKGGMELLICGFQVRFLGGSPCF
jgi:hypothetical protein